MHFDFMTPDVWNGLVLGVVLIGAAFAILRLISDRAVYRRQQAAQRDPAPRTETDASAAQPQHPPHHRSRR